MAISWRFVSGFPLNLLEQHLLARRDVFNDDAAKNQHSVYLPEALARKYPNADKEWRWQYAFISTKLSLDPRSDMVRHHHRDEKTIQRAMKKSCDKVGLTKCASPPHFAPFICYPFIGKWL
ncbi:MAG: hypothetical protein COA63_002715 [Methylophaga sp.]|nr:hypothetical protein [Methylophaga sp.]